MAQNIASNFAKSINELVKLTADGVVDPQIDYVTLYHNPSPGSSPVLGIDPSFISI